MTSNFVMEFDLGDIQFDNVPPGEVDFILASEEGEEGELLRFRNAVLARAEVNKNRDGLTEANISELADTLPLTAIDIEHEERVVVGFFTNARNTSGALVVDGVIFARRFPEVVKDVVDGTLKLSIEGMAKVAKVVNGVRWFEGLKAVGGGLTRKPAGSNTGFANSSILMIASEMEENEVDPKDVKISELEATVAELNQKIETLESTVTEANGSLEAAQSEATLAREEAAQEIEKAKVQERLSAQRAARLLTAGHDQEQVDEIWEELGTVSEKVFAMMQVTLATPEAEAPQEITPVVAAEEEVAEPDAENVVSASVQDVDDKAQTIEFVY